MSNSFSIPRNPFYLVILIAFLHVQCGSYQGTSYYYADGIYNRELPPSATENTAPDSSQNYYKNYFNNLAEQYGSAPQEATVMTDVDGYASTTANSYAAADNQPWGAQTQRTNIYIYDNTRWGGGPWNWGFNSWNWGFSPWGFNSWGFNSPFNRWNRPFGFGPSWGWGFYSPFNGPFYDPFLDFHYGNRWAYYNYGNFYYGPRFGNRFWNQNIRVSPRRSIARVASRRGEKGYDNNRRTRPNRDGKQANENKSTTTLSTAGIRRYNTGRTVGLFSRIDNVPQLSTSRATGAASTSSGSRYTRVPSSRSVRGSSSNTVNNGRRVRYKSTPSRSNSNYRPSRSTNSGRSFSSSRSSGRSFSNSRSSGRSSSSSRNNGGRRN